MAIKYATEALEKSALYVPYAGWTAGLSSWKLKKYNEAAEFFSNFSISLKKNDWHQASGSFWVARCYAKINKYKDINMVPGNAIGGLIAALIAFLMANKITVPAEVVGYIIAMGAILSISFSLITIAPRYMPAAEVGMIMPLETVLGSLIAWYWIKEVPSNNAIIGGTIVVITLFLHSWYSTRLAKNQLN